jgi:hypothetical protein
MSKFVISMFLSNHSDNGGFAIVWLEQIIEYGKTFALRKQTSIFGPKNFFEVFRLFKTVRFTGDFSPFGRTPIFPMSSLTSGRP